MATRAMFACLFCAEDEHFVGLQQRKAVALRRPRTMQATITCAVIYL